MCYVVVAVTLTVPPEIDMPWVTCSYNWDTAQYTQVYMLTMCVCAHMHLCVSVLYLSFHLTLCVAHGMQSKAAEEIKTKQKKEVETLKELDLSQCVAHFDCCVIVCTST